MYHVEKTKYGCTWCGLGKKPVKLRRQWVHFEQFRIVVCPNREIKPMSDGSKRGVSHTPNVKPNG